MLWLFCLYVPKNWWLCDDDCVYCLYCESRVEVKLLYAQTKWASKADAHSDNRQIQKVAVKQQ